jgi:hypothetical protein
MFDIFEENCINICKPLFQQSEFVYRATEATENAHQNKKLL